MAEKLKHINLSPSSNIRNNPKLDNWQKIYCATFLLTPRELQKHLEKNREQLLGLYDNDAFFNIQIAGNPYLEREFEGEVKTLRAMGDTYKADIAERYKEHGLQEMAKEYAKHQQVEYQHIIDTFKDIECADEFMCLMLNETLSKIYYKGENGAKTFVQHREQGKSIAGHMVLNKITIETILNNVNKYANFSDLYFAALDELNKQTFEKSTVSIDGVETFDMGQWLKFNSKTIDPANFEENVQKLTALVQNTPWCTKTLAGSQLSIGDFFVFVDLESNPHIAIRLLGNQIEEVRGILNGRQQEIEPEYMSVAQSFLENNKGVRQGKEWFENIQWNKKLIDYSEIIESGAFSSDDVEQLLAFLKSPSPNDIANRTGNGNLKRLKANLPLITPQLANYFGCPAEHFFYGDFSSRADKENQNIKFIYGSLLLTGLKQKHLNNPINKVTGNVDTRKSDIVELNTLQDVGGSIYIDGLSNIQSLPSLNNVGSEAHFGRKVKLAKCFNAKRIYYRDKRMSEFKIQNWKSM